MSWKFSAARKRFPRLRSPVLIEGMPGIGNVGKVAMDFVIDELDAVKLYDIFSYSIPNSVFVDEDNLVDLPSISLYCKKDSNGKDLLMLAGDVQPVDEESCYSFSDSVLDMLEKMGGSGVVTLGGIGLPSIPKAPKLYCTGNMKAAVEQFTRISGVDGSLYGVVGPIMGVSGVLLGLAKRRNIPAAALLAETYGHPMYLGIKGAREIVRVLNTAFGLKIDLHEMDREISKLETEMSRKQKAFEAGRRPGRQGSEASYIG